VAASPGSIVDFATTWRGDADMQTAPITQTSRKRGQSRRVGAAAAVLAGLLLVAGGCAAGSSNSSGGSRASANGDQNSVNTGASAPSGGSQDRSVGSFSIDFATCMRAHGVPNFPDPDGQPGQLGPNGGIDPGSAQFQAAINGPCKSLAPPQWLDSGSGSGPGSVPGGH
jgi:hypothetical protein